jgi:hypothetical protein
VRASPREFGVIAAAPMACTTRAAIRRGSEPANAAIAELATNKDIPSTNRRLRP